MRKEFLVFGSPCIGEAEISEVLDCLRSGWIGTGPKVMKFQEIVRKYMQAKYAVALNSCTAALHLAMLVSELEKGSEVITTTMTFCSTVNSIIHSGLKPILVDVDKSTQLIDPSKIEAAITPKTRAIIVVHLHGRPCNMDAIIDIASRNNLLVIEDAAHAIEAKYHGKKVGSISDMTCFSFYVTKNVCTGEGGMLTTNNQEYANKAQMYGLHGMSHDAWKRYSDESYKHYTVEFPGFKYNMMDMQAAIGIHQFEKVDKWLERRNEIWAQYNQAFESLPVVTPPPDEKNTVHARHLYTLMIDKEKCGISRDSFIGELKQMNIGTGVHYIGVHSHPYYRRKFGFKPEDFPNAGWIGERTVSLPLSGKLTNEDVDDVITAVKKVIDKSQKRLLVKC